MSKIKAGDYLETRIGEIPPPFFLFKLGTQSP